MGYVNQQPQDNYLLQSAADGGTSQLAAPTAMEGIGQSIGQGAAGFVTSLENTASDASGFLARHNMGGPLALAIHSLLGQPAVTSNRDSLEKWEQQDKPYQGSVAQTAGGVTKGLLTFAPALLTGGAALPVGAGLMGGTAADDTYRDMRAQGADDTTAKEAAALQGAIGAAGVVPVFKFAGLGGKVLAGATANAVLGTAGRAANWAVLKANGYDDMAAMQHPLDRQAILAEAIVGAGMGLGAHFLDAGKPAGEPLPPDQRPSPDKVDAGQVVLDQVHAADSGIGVPTSPDIAALHEQVLARAIDDFNNGRETNLTAEEAHALTEGMAQHPADFATAKYIHDWSQQLPNVHIADTLGPLLDDAQARIDARAPHFEAAEHAANDADQTGMASPDAVDDAAMRQLETLHGDEAIPQEDGTTQTVHEMAEAMRAKVANAESDNKLMDAAVACFIRNGDHA